MKYSVLDLDHTRYGPTPYANQPASRILSNNKKEGNTSHPGRRYLVTTDCFVRAHAPPTSPSPPHILTSILVATDIMFQLARLTLREATQSLSVMRCFSCVLAPTTSNATTGRSIRFIEKSYCSTTTMKTIRHLNSRTFRFYTRSTNSSNDILDGEIVQEHTNENTEKRVAIPLLQQHLDTKQRKLEDILDRSLKAFEEASKTEDRVEMEEALTKLRMAYEDLQYWDQAFACEERLETLWVNDNSDDDKLKRAHSWYRRGRYVVYGTMGLSTDASKYYRRALDGYDAYYGKDALHPDKGHAFMSLAGVEYAQGSYDKALDILKTQSEPHFRIHEKSTDTASEHPDLFKCLQHQGLVYRGMEDFEHALEVYEEARAFLLDNISNFKDEEAREKLQNIQMDIADMHLALDNLAEALDLYKAIWEDDRSFRELNDQGEVTLTGMDGVILHNLGRIYAQQEENALAIETLKDAIEIKKAWYGATHPEVGKSLQLLGALYARQDNSYEALKCFEHCLTIARRQADGNDNDPGVMFALRNIALLEGKKVPRWTEGDSNDDAR